MSLTVPQHHPAPGRSPLLCPRARTSVTALLQAAQRCGQATILTTTRPVITATSPWSSGMGGGPALLPPLVTSGYCCTSGLSLTAALGEAAKASSCWQRDQQSEETWKPSRGFRYSVSIPRPSTGLRQILGMLIAAPHETLSLELINIPLDQTLWKDCLWCPEV